jgi:CheY-like chemotaxis protein/curved DNA-binding protein CbpA
MPQGPLVLIVEDEQGSARLIASLCEELGLGSRSTRSGREALELLRQPAEGGGPPFACLVLDIVLDEMDGFQVAQRTRAEPFGAELPIVVVSGVYKQLPEGFVTSVKPDAYLPKPFEPSALREALRKLCRVKAPEPLAGDLSAKPAAAALVDLLRQKATGVLTFTQDQTVRKLHLQSGQVRLAQSNVLSEAAGAPLVASGAIKQASFDRGVALARQQKIPLHEALASARVLSPDQLKAALKQQTQDVVVGALSLAAGSYTFESLTPDQLATVPDARMSPVLLILEWARRTAKAAASRSWLEAHPKDFLTRSPELERELFALKSTWPGESVTSQASAGRTVVEVLRRAKESELPLLHALCVSGLVAMAKPSVRPAAAAPADEDQGKIFSARDEQARRQIFAEKERLAEATHYELLAVPADATPEAIKAGYLAAAKRYHSDRFSGLSLGNARRAAEELFARVSEANEVLGSPQKRADYDIYLDRKSKGLPTDVAAILKAESIFQKGEALLKAGHWSDAEAAFREALTLNHAEAEFHAYLGMAIARGQHKPEEGLDCVAHALELDPRSKAAQLFRGILKDEVGETDEAKKILRKLLEQDPDFAEAKTELSRIRSGQKPGDAKKSAGVLGRLLKK